jgi:hypothetical protein
MIHGYLEYISLSWYGIPGNYKMCSRNDIAEILLKLALNINQSSFHSPVLVMIFTQYVLFSFIFLLNYSSHQSIDEYFSQ